MSEANQSAVIRCDVRILDANHPCDAYEDDMVRAVCLCGWTHHGSLGTVVTDAERHVAAHPRGGYYRLNNGRKIAVEPKS